MKTLVIHPTHLKERGEHIDRMLRDIGLEYDIVNEGNDDLQVKAYLKKYLKNGQEEMLRKVPRSLCTISHFLAYEIILSEGLEGALILEDDILLHKDFKMQFEQSIKEYERYYQNKNIIISYEDSPLLFVPRSLREKGRMLYSGYRDRLSGAYFINNCAAKAILDELQANRCDRAIDLYHYQLIQEKVINYLWCHPSIATQGTATGFFETSLSSNKKKLRKLSWFFQKKYKLLLYWFR
jgi:glycosyl transferase family 25